MDRPRQQVFFLEKLPPDIWAYIVWYIPGEQLGRLLMTGATRLSQRLKTFNVVKSIKLGKDYLVFDSCPGFLNAFPSLEELSIYSGNRMWSCRLSLKIDMVPFRVKKLELTGDWHDCADTLFGEPTGTLKLSNHLPRLEALHFRDLTMANYSWMRHAPPSLTSLQLECWDGTVELPSSLIEFQTSYAELSTNSFVSKLPALKSFVVTVSFCGVDLMLLRLDVPALSVTEQYFCKPPNMPNHSFFPPQLTHLNIPGVHLSSGTTKLLPPSLTYLEIGNLCEQVCEHLPTGLKTLKSSRTLVSPNLINFLPKSLTFLQSSSLCSEDIWFDCITGERIDSLSSLPEYTTHENCVAKSCDWGQISRFPPTLTFIALGRYYELGDSFLLPQQLPNLQEFVLTDSRHFSDLSIPVLSPYLTTLDLSSSSQVSGRSFQFLPRGLTFIDLSSSESIFDFDIQHLPRTLKQINFNRAIHLTDSCITDLPPHLESLEVTFNSLITTSSIPHFPYPLRSISPFAHAGFANWELRLGVGCPKNGCQWSRRTPTFQPRY